MYVVLRGEEAFRRGFVRVAQDQLFMGTWLIVYGRTPAYVGYIQ
jgi:hypothetical protein